MNQDVIFKTFKTYKSKYLFDRHTNTVIRLTNDEYDEFGMIQRGKLASGKSKATAKYQAMGLLQPNIIQKIEHNQSSLIEHHANKRLESLILQVTQQCNLRCEYCAYSGIYESNRTHANKKMSLETAKKAIDFFFEHNYERTEINIGFYGGEPLLEFDLIKECISYARCKCEGKDMTISITTNGTLLRDEVIDYIVENNIDIGVSLDGSKEEHDRSRKFANGNGSFDTVIENIRKLIDNYPEYEANHFRIMTTVNPYMNLGCVLEFFESHEVLSDQAIMFNNMTPSNLKSDIPPNEASGQTRKYEYIC